MNKHLEIILKYTDEPDPHTNPYGETKCEIVVYTTMNYPALGEVTERITAKCDSQEDIGKTIQNIYDSI
jgi:hypothetical protein